MCIEQVSTEGQLDVCRTGQHDDALWCKSDKMGFCGYVWRRHVHAPHEVIVVGCEGNVAPGNAESVVQPKFPPQGGVK